MDDPFSSEEWKNVMGATMSIESPSSSSEWGLEGGFCSPSITVLAKMKNWPRKVFSCPVHPESAPAGSDPHSLQTCRECRRFNARVGSRQPLCGDHWLNFYWMGPFVVQRVWTMYRPCNQLAGVILRCKWRTSVSSPSDYVFKKRGLWLLMFADDVVFSRVVGWQAVSDNHH